MPSLIGWVHTQNDPCVTDNMPHAEKSAGCPSYRNDRIQSQFSNNYGSTAAAISQKT